MSHSKTSPQGGGSTAGRPPKTMSNRLMTMKFMQRAGASASTTPPSTDQSRNGSASKPSSPSTYASIPPASGTPDGSAHKRVKLTPQSAVTDASATDNDHSLGHASANISSSDQFPHTNDSSGRAETPWSYAVSDSAQSAPRIGASGWRIERIGYASLDGAGAKATASKATPAASRDLESRANGSITDSNVWDGTKAGRRSFGGFKRKAGIDKPSADSASAISSSSSDEDSSGASGSESGEIDDHDDETGGLASRKTSVKALERSEKQARRAARKALKEARQVRGKAKPQKKVKLSRLTSISGGGGSSPSINDAIAKRECHLCGKRRHLKRDCPQKQQSKQQWKG